MQAIILVGGAGTRLRSVVNEIPKPMADVKGKPFLEYLLLQLKHWGITDIILSSGYKSEIIKTYFNDGKKQGINIEYSEETEPLGTGGALKQAEHLIKTDSFILMNGDSYFNVNIEKILKWKNDYDCFGILSLFRIQNAERYGSVVLDKDNRIIEFSEKAKNKDEQYINGGIYLFNKKITDFIPEKKCSLENDILPELVKLHKFYGLVFNDFFIDIGIPSDYYKINNTTEFPPELTRKC
ncbi:nucleotidyltransferase family protein [Candidatus Dependentiae bacterium]|nr:nucleotidyltransferase family protein [Candidatus Dependentiae bacterium]